MESTAMKQAFEDVRKAQRLLVAYHKRVMPLIDQIAKELDFYEFVEWKPSRYNLPTKSTNPPVEYWAWDMSPMAHASFLYLHDSVAKTTIASATGWVLKIRLVTDSGMNDAFNDTHKDWDPLKFAPASDCETLIELIAYRPIEPETELSWKNLAWGFDRMCQLDGELHNVCKRGQVQSNQGEYFGTSESLETFITPEGMATFIQRFRDLMKKTETEK